MSVTPQNPSKNNKQSPQWPEKNKSTMILANKITNEEPRMISNNFDLDGFQTANKILNTSIQYEKDLVNVEETDNEANNNHSLASIE